MQTTFFYLGRFLKKLADDQCSSITVSTTHATFYHSSGLTRNLTSNGSIYYALYLQIPDVVKAARRRCLFLFNCFVFRSRIIMAKSSTSSTESKCDDILLDSTGKIMLMFAFQQDTSFFSEVDNRLTPENFPIIRSEITP